jgi:hypothetical protein
MCVFPWLQEDQVVVMVLQEVKGLTRTMWDHLQIMVLCMNLHNMVETEDMVEGPHHTRDVHNHQDIMVAKEVKYMS